jgi:hypothetical protein
VRGDAKARQSLWGIAHAADSILQHRPDARFSDIGRFKLCLQNKAFLHVLAKARMAFRSAHVRDRNRADARFLSSARSIPAQDSARGVSIWVEERGLRPPSQCKVAQMELFRKAVSS